ncbi:MAG: hypothetical protein KDD63_17025, partial [Bacteroidetes bacterium]|nr:hypothetical protein [Bacteroidota bacterium]
MKRNRLLSLGFILGLSVTILFGQNEIDALRHSQSTITGTARALGTGGAFSAVGADMSSAALNPAGFGLYRSSTFTISPGFHTINNQAQYFDSTLTASDNQFNIGNWGMAFHNKNYYDNGRVREENDRGLVSYTFAFGQNQLENYRRQVNASGFNPHSSISEKWANEANGKLPTELLFDSNEELAFYLLIIDTMENRDGATYFPAVTNGQVQQTAQMVEDGRRNKWFASLAGNFNNKIFVGGSIGIQSLRYSQTFDYKEEDINHLYEVYDPDPDNGFPLEFPTNEIRYNETFSTRGVGINA